MKFEKFNLLRPGLQSKEKAFSSERTENPSLSSAPGLVVAWLTIVADSAQGITASWLLNLWWKHPSKRQRMESG